MAINNNYMFVGTSGGTGGLYYSTNNGINWIQSYLNNRTIFSLGVYNNYVIAGTDGYGIYYSVDNGLIWSQSDINNIGVYYLNFDGATAYAGTQNGIYKSTNFGVNSIMFGLSNKYIYSIQFNGQYIYVGTEHDGVYLCTKQGLIWNQINDGFPSENMKIMSLVFTNNYFVAGSHSRSVWRRPKSQVNLKILSRIIPDKYSLNQNFPNPFNPTTDIRYSIPKNEFVRITIYNALGSIIETLVNEKRSPGEYEVTFDGSKYSSGVYFYKLNACEYSNTKRMILIK